MLLSIMINVIVRDNDRVGQLWNFAIGLIVYSVKYAISDAAFDLVVV